MFSHANSFYTKLKPVTSACLRLLLFFFPIHMVFNYHHFLLKTNGESPAPNYCEIHPTTAKTLPALRSPTLNSTVMSVKSDVINQCNQTSRCRPVRWMQRVIYLDSTLCCHC